METKMMRRLIFTAAILITSGYLYAGAKLSDSVKNVAVSDNAVSTTVVSSNLEAAVMTPAIPGFGTVAASFTTACVHTKMKMTDWQVISPISMTDRWYFRIKHKDKPEELLNVTGLIDSHTINKGLDYYYYYVPLENKGNVVRFTKEAAYIKNLKFPVFGFIFLDVVLEPEIQYMKFPLVTGDTWESKSTGTVQLMNFLKLSRQTSAKFTVLEQGDVTINGKSEHVFRIANDIDKGDGKITHEEDWYAVNIGLIYQNTDAYTLEIVKYVPGDNAVPEKISSTKL
jgi:hypothetical protein